MGFTSCSTTRNSRPDLEFQRIATKNLRRLLLNVERMLPSDAAHASELCRRWHHSCSKAGSPPERSFLAPGLGLGNFGSGVHRSSTIRSGCSLSRARIEALNTSWGAFREPVTRIFYAHGDREGTRFAKVYNPGIPVFAASQKLLCGGAPGSKRLAGRRSPMSTFALRRSEGTLEYLEDNGLAKQYTEQRRRAERDTGDTARTSEGAGGRTQSDVQGVAQRGGRGTEEGPAPLESRLSGEEQAAPLEARLTSILPIRPASTSRSRTKPPYRIPSRP